LAIEAIEKAIERRVEAWVVLPGEPSIEVRTEVQASRASSDGSRLRHKVEGRCAFIAPTWCCSGECDASGDTPKQGIAPDA